MIQLQNPFKMIKIIVFLVVIVISDKGIFASDVCDDKARICGQQKHCVDCIRVHHCCTWCYKEDFAGDRCIAKNSSQEEQCGQSFLEDNFQTTVESVQVKEFTDVKDDVNKAVQFKTSEFNIDLRYGEPVNITVQYRPAKDYPLDLYYLMDLTWSMQPELDTLKRLGTQLAQLLQDLTENHRLAFGSYIDKVSMPYFRLDPDNRDNPCKTEQEVCEKGYLFKHKLNFTKEVGEFIRKVNASGVSANLDDVEGGIDALMQIALCGGRLGWAENSRKLVIIATDGRMHFAGDGILSGHVMRNKNECLVDHDGNYSSFKNYDYPSAEEINRVLKNKKINVIVAAKSSVLNYYNKMGELLKNVFFIGELKNESSNILNLTKDGYHAFLKQVGLTMNTEHVDGLETEFFADCDKNGKWVKSSDCMNAAEGKEQNFKVQFLLKKYQNKHSDVVFIEEKNINDKIKVNLRYVGSTCSCVNLGKTDTTCAHGELNCGECLCDDGWTGRNCDDECIHDYSPCRELIDGIPSVTCSGRGDCICSKCNCHLPFYQGAYCQFNCPYDHYTGTVCGGHGRCVSDGLCECDQPYLKRDCSCKNSTENCQIPGISTENYCNNRGICECNHCKCSQGYHGNFCEMCDNCTALCSHYEKDVYEFIVNNKKQNPLLKIQTTEDLSDDSCLHRYTDKKGHVCDILFTYSINFDQFVEIISTKAKCSAPMAAGLLAAIIIGAFVAVLVLIIIVWKGRNMYLDKQEYDKFLSDKEKSYHNEMNPLYKGPTTSYSVPIELRNLHSKND